ncbi:MAG TPA: 4Fe-4S dicluster domain-containing protein [Gemmatimonadales bacterium]|nr:4Fe-4S dicluster domain-containing protein [Gemmatimonadales bacterium]
MSDPLRDLIGTGGDRRDFFRQSFGQWAEKLLEKTEERIVQQKYFRPPGALPEVAFLAACTRCGACEPVCPPHAIRPVPTSGGLAAGTPMLEPRMQPCTVCTDMPCVRACPTGALTLPRDGWAGYRMGALTFLPERCVTYQGTACRVCADVCPVGEAALIIDDAGHPVIRREGCVGCGVCVRECITSPSSFTIELAEA